MVGGVGEGVGWNSNCQVDQTAMSVVTLCFNNLLHHYMLQWSGEGDNHLILISFSFKQTAFLINWTIAMIQLGTKDLLSNKCRGGTNLAIGSSASR